MSIEKIAVVGAGAWGTALAQVAATGGREVLLWALEDDVVRAVNTIHQNPIYLKDIPLEPSIRATSNFSDLSQADAWLVVTPAQHMRAVLGRAPCPGMPLVLCSKGIEERSGQLLHHVAKDVCATSPVAVLSGPCFAHEVARGLPTAVTLACEDEALGAALHERLALPTFRLYSTDDVAGAEVGGAIKNVLAIACGIVEGKAMGQNARAAIIARGFAEMKRFGAAVGAREETLAGLSGLGDLVLTCTSTASRNFSLGKAIGEGRSAAELMSDRTTVAEGAHTAPVLARIARDGDIDMPIVETVAALLSGEVSIDEAVEQILSRPPRPENA
ncbi:NAD(P)H-dependent glycerol-3-phosphate dehydrogenase [Sphingomicrobium astaxanthinifaciens]|uniref:NAD(P)H-dependent glycerol-3-phosphate dehydrogenase n=1 Tax=Sphingomicrobium astaxanthinifaciens TaxID=1227949 RepID=UPI001FCCB48C|nr:NAD(P)H-dependent glycerol-3-phosphate dehydrogenase [Sphingomicrobium astaxanthinifaciens]MCJ7421220.1 NAD(P)-dependent glycerol-3-phosphate dehydrogenase [Sphingomicrobium astaxanthinifaciens]